MIEGFTFENTKNGYQISLILSAISKLLALAVSLTSS